MQNLTTTTLAILIAAICGNAASAAAPKILHDFGLGSQASGSSLYASLLLDSAGNLYGTAEFGGVYNRGVVFRLSKNVTGPWTETVLHNFKGGTSDGETSHASVVMDEAGNLYGTTTAGGTGACPQGCGVLFQLTPTASGPWTETIVHQFAGGSDGAQPYSSVIFDAPGNLYGATTAGGSHNAGVVYKLTPAGPGLWNETVIYNFLGSPDAATPWAAPVFDAAGHLYGITANGGANGKGAIYGLAPQPDGSWKESVLHSFIPSTDGSDLFESLVLDDSGNLYGSAETGGSANCGVAFELAKETNGWTFKVLHNFLGVAAQDGENPNALVFDALGNLYGTSVGGGVDNPGTIFKLTPQSSGAWTESVLYNFTGGNDGAYPSVPLVIGPAGHLYGTTLWGGPAGDTTGGVAFEFTP